MIVLQSNQNNAMAKDTEICFTLVASMGMGGGYVPMIVQEQPIAITNDITIKIDVGGVAFSLRSRDYKDPPIVIQANQDYHQEECVLDDIETAPHKQTALNKRTKQNTQTPPNHRRGALSGGGEERRRRR